MALTPSLGIRGRARAAARSLKNYPMRRRYGADFGRNVALGAIARPGSVDYIPSAWIAAARSIRRLGLGSGDVFVDVGAGKGMVVLLAAEHPVRRVIGVELHPELAREADDHLARNRHRRAAQHVEIVCGDALDWEVPADMTVLYMNSPFTGPTFERFIDRVLDSLEAHPRALRILYAYPVQHRLLMQRTGARVLDVQPSGLLRRRGWWTSRETTVTYGVGEGPFPPVRGRAAPPKAIEYLQSSAEV
jgi:SAM-dependent methyltransferase